MRPHQHPRLSLMVAPKRHGVVAAGCAQGSGDHPPNTTRPLAAPRVTTRSIKKLLNHRQDASANVCPRRLDILLSSFRPPLLPPLPPPPTLCDTGRIGEYTKPHKRNLGAETKQQTPCATKAGWICKSPPCPLYPGSQAHDTLQRGTTRSQGFSSTKPEKPLADTICLRRELIPP